MLSDVLLVAVIAIGWVVTGLDVDREGTALYLACRRRIMAWQTERADQQIQRATEEAMLTLLDEVRQHAHCGP